jgi:hypothetical protein
MKRLLPVAVKIQHVSIVAVSSVAIAGLALSPQPATAQGTATITVSSAIPLEVSDPANLSEAAAFAWNEFIALTWPALPQGQNNSFPRGKPDPSLKYGQRGETGQVVWETFRHKAEAFPGQGNPNGYDPSAPDLGFAAKPDYVYLPTPENGIPVSGEVPPLNSDWKPPFPPFNNLDEVTQIGLNAMYAGAVDPSPNGPASQSTNLKEKILFEAKVNEVVYQYVAQPRTDVTEPAAASPYSYFQSDNQIVQTIEANSVSYLETGDKTTYPGPYINLPPSDPLAKKVGSIEIKASFRRLGPKDDPTKYYTAAVRYYKGDGKGKVFGYADSNDPTVNEVWGLTSLHIIQKTPNAPTFVFATFGHINNILDAAGNNVELPDGTTKPEYMNVPPFLPALTITPSANNMPQKVVVAGNGMPPVNTSTYQLYFKNVGGDIDNIGGNIYKLGGNILNAAGELYSLPINVSRRLFPIPPTITAVNQAAQAAIRTANPDAVWLNYRLVNVQAQPLDVNAIPAGEESTFYLSNEVVETNPTLQHFSGRVDSATSEPTNFKNGHYFKNTYVVQSNGNIAGYTMGGCMGCHGTVGQLQGGDFSRLLASGRVQSPDAVETDENNAAVRRALIRRYFSK